LMGLHATFADQILMCTAQSESPARGLYEISQDPVYGWNTSFAPIPLPDDEVLAYTVANSPLCHAAISKWCYVAGVDFADKNRLNVFHKVDRCAKFAGGVAAFAAELLNGLTGDFEIPEQTEVCYSCHSADSSVGSLFPAQQGHMDCTECHADLTPHYGKLLIVDDVWTLDGDGNPKSTFTAGDSIQYKVQFTFLGSGTVFVKTYQSRAAGTCGKIQGFKNSQTLMAGTYEWTWSGTIPSGCTGDAKVIMDLKMFDYQGGVLLSEVKKNYKFKIT